MKRLALCSGLLLMALILPTNAQKSSAIPENLKLRAASAPVADASNPDAPGWMQVPARIAALNRTPPLYDTDPPATSEIALVEVRLSRSGGKLLVHLSWRDATEDSATLAAVPSAPYEGRNLKEQTQSTDRFFDACAVMFPAGTPGAVTPSLQMGDQSGPVTIYYWNAARGAMLMEAQGRGTTRRTGTSFPTFASYRAGTWRVVLELKDLPAGTPLAFAVWNGSQLDRDGRKYFTIWHWLE